MRVNAAFLTNHIEIRDSMIYALGAFPEWITLSENPPCDVGIAMGICFEFDREDTGLPQTIGVAIEHADTGQQMGDGTLTVQRQPSPQNAPIYLNAWANFGFRCLDVGMHRVRFHRDGEDLYVVRFGVRLSEPT